MAGAHRFPLATPMALSLALVCVVCAASAEDYVDWSHSTKVYVNTTSDGAAVEDTVTAFPLLVRLDPAVFTFSQAEPQGADVRFASRAGTHLPYQIERWDTAAGAAAIWVLVDTIVPGSARQYIVMHWGKTGAVDSSCASAVFRTQNGYGAAWHLNESPADNVAGHYDATANGNSVTPMNFQDSDGGTTDTLGIVGGADYLDNSDDMFEANDHSSLQSPGNITVSCWIRPDTGCTGGNFVLMNRSDESGGHPWAAYLMYLDWGSLKPKFIWASSTDSVCYATAGAGVNAGQWYHLAGVRDGSHLRIYVNGVETTDPPYSSGTPTGHMLNPNWGLKMGAENTSGSFKYHGLLDEVRVDTVARSADYLRLSYQNQRQYQNVAVVYGVEEYSDWSYSKQIRFNTGSTGANVAGTVYGFPVLVRLNKGSFNFGDARSDGRDIRFASQNGTHLAYEIQRWDPEKSLAEIWVKVDTLLGNDSTQHITMFWGKSGFVPDLCDPSAVFDTAAGFAGVWHLEEDAQGTGAERLYLDATAAGAHLDDSTSSDGKAGVVGLGQAFDKESGDFAVNGGHGDTLSALTLSAWVYLDTIYSSSQQVDERHNYVMGNFRWWPMAGYQMNAFSDQLVTMLKVTGSSGAWYYTDGVFEAPRTWYHISVTWDSSGALKFYRNGVLIDEQSTGAGSLINSAEVPVSLGYGGGVVGIDGRLDEVRRCFAARSADWMKLCYENQRLDQKFVNVPAYQENYALWHGQQRIYFNTTQSGTGVDSAQSGFVYLVRLNTSNFSFHAASGNGQDIRFSDPDGRHLNYQIDTWDAAKGQGAVWVRVPRVDGNSWGDYITMHYGRFGAPDRQMPDSVWDSAYASVWHFAERPLGDCAAILTDATDGSNGITPQASMTAADRVQGAVGTAVDLDGTNDWLYTATAYTNPKPFTLFAWIKTTTTVGGKILGFEKERTGGSGQYDRQVWMASDGKVHFGVYPGTERRLSTMVALNDGNWHQIAAVLGGSGVGQRLYVDGELVASDEATTSAEAFEGYWRLGWGSTWYPNPSSAYFDGALDEVRIETTARGPQWIKLSYENQRPDLSFQTTERVTLSPVFDGTLRSKPNEFERDTTFVAMRRGDNPANDTVEHGLLQFNLTEARRMSQMGWTLESARLNLTIDSIATPTEHGAVRVGIYSDDRLVPFSRRDGYTAWTEDHSSIAGRTPITMAGRAFDRGVGGQPQSNGGWSWVIYDLRSEMERLGIDSLPDSVSGWMGFQDSSGAVNLYVKVSAGDTCPDTSDWFGNDGTVDEKWSTNWTVTYEHFNVPLRGEKWLFLGMRSASADTADFGVWGDIAVWTDIPTSTEIALFQVASDSIDTSAVDFTHRYSGTYWRHVAVESDGATDSSEGIGTEDLVSGYWNRYKSAYRARGAVARVPVDGRRYGAVDSTPYFAGILGDSRLLPADIANGYRPFVEDKSTDSGHGILIDSVWYPAGLGGAPINAGGGYAWVLYDLTAERERLGYGAIRSITGILGSQDGSAGVEAYVRTSTSSTRPTESEWTTPAGSVVQQAYKSSGQSKVALAVNQNAGSIKWLWLGVRMTSGDPSAAHAVSAGVAINTEAVSAYTVSLASKELTQAVASAFEHASNGGADSANSRVTLLGTLLDSGRVTARASEANDSRRRPSLELTFSDSRTLLSWSGAGSALALPAERSMTLTGSTSPSTGDGRFDRVVRFHSPDQCAMVRDTGVIDYARGRMSFWYQKTLGSGDASGAVLFERTASDTTRFALVRLGTGHELAFLYGDTTGDSTGSNLVQWSMVDSFITSIDGDTVWQRDTIADLFDGNQHQVVFTWDAATAQVALSIDGRRPRMLRGLLRAPHPATWYSDSLAFGRNSDGYMEHLCVYSQTSAPAALALESSRLVAVAGYLPYLQPGFGDTVDCIVIAPGDPLMRQELDKYALRNNSFGVRTQVIDLADVSRFYSGADTQERLRNFLGNAVSRWHSRYLVLGAAVDLIPNRQVAFQTKDGHEATTDRYYACLEGSWNDDGDEYFAEPEDGVDVTAELTVGRFPAMDWRELRSMVDKSSMALSLPPYGGQCLESAGEVMLSGVRMFDDIGGQADGAYYASQLADILREGAYTGTLDSVGLRTYFPVDDSSLDSTEQLKRTAFVDAMRPMPGLWVHFGHGDSRHILIDEPWVSLTYDDVPADTAFGHSRRPMHVRVVGCETAAQRQLSMARAFLARPLGGAVSYVGAAEYSYPAVEASILQEELKALADSSVFTWGDVYRMASDRVIAANAGWDIARWVVLSRNYLGDPVLPVRTQRIHNPDTLALSCSPATVTARDAQMVVTVTAAGEPVEGAQVGIISQNVPSREASDSSAYRVLTDLAFGRGLTDRFGNATVQVRVGADDTLVVSAVHPDYRATRMALPVVLSQQHLPVVSMRVYDVEYPYPAPQWDTPYDTLASNGVIEAGDRITVIFRFEGKPGERINVSQVTVMPDTAGSGIDIEAYNGSSTGRPGALGWLIHHTRYYTLRRCPAGVTDLRFVLIYTDSSAGIDTVRLSVPVAGPALTPVISLLYDPNSSSAAIPAGGHTARMQVLLGNGSPATALNLVCRLEESCSHVTVSTATTDTLRLVKGGGSGVAAEIEFTVSNAYSFDQKGVLPARLITTGSNTRPDTLNIDLNPLYVDTFKVLPRDIYADYNGGVHLSWTPQRFDSRGNRRSDLLGYAVTRTPYCPVADTLMDSTVLVTPSPVTSSNYVYDPLGGPADTIGKYEYEVWLVDSSYNCAQFAFVDVERGWKRRLRDNFPVFADDMYHMPIAASDVNRDGMGEVVMASWPPKGYAASGQGAVGGGPHMSVGVTQNVPDNQGMAFADLDGDGSAEGIFLGYDTVAVKNYADSSKSWKSPSLLSLDQNPRYHTRWIRFNREPALADVDLDGDLDIIVIGMDFDEVGVGPRATTLYVFDGDGTGIARKHFRFKSYAPAVAVGDFKRGDDGKPEILVAALRNEGTGWDGGRWMLYLLGNVNLSAGTVEVLAAQYVCNVAGPTDEEVIDSSRGTMVNTGLAVGNIYGGTDKLEVVLGIGRTNKSGGNVGDSLLVFSVDTATGAISGQALVRHAVEQSRPVFNPGSPALGDLDGDGTKDVAFAVENAVYLLKMTDDTGGPFTSLVPDSLGPAVALGAKPDNRMFTDEPMPQALIADIDNDGRNEVLAQHYGDGAVWAYQPDLLDFAASRYAPGFPLKMHGDVRQPCRIVDIDNNGVLDLVAADNAGYLFSFALDSGTIYEQPWTGRWGNNWNTGTQTYRDAGTVGHLYERWTQGNGSRAPYRWMETGYFNSLTESGNNFTASNGVLTSTALNDRNYHFTGPGMEGLSDYTVSGTFKFDVDTVEFGINFYSQWPDSARKYTVMRERDGLLRLYYYSGATTRTLLGTLDVADTGANNDRADSVGKWYDYEIGVLAGIDRIAVRCWRFNRPSDAGIYAVGGQLSSGLVGLVAHQYGGTRYWGPITVVSNKVATPATITVEDFRKDSLVDVKPYVSENWHPDYSFNRFALGSDVSGFVLDTTAGRLPVLTYRHKPGVQYPVTCRLVPQTNLQWKDYTFTGTIVKPNQAAWDSVTVGVLFHCQGADSCYKLLFERTGVYLDGGQWSHSNRSGTIVGAGDSVEYSAKVQSDSLGGVVDSVVGITISIRVNGGEWEPIAEEVVDHSSARLPRGPPGILVDASPVSVPSRSALQPLRLMAARIEKAR